MLSARGRVSRFVVVLTTYPFTTSPSTLVPQMSAKNLLEKESILAYKMHIDPKVLESLEYGEVLYLEKKLIEYLEKEMEAYNV